MGCNDKSILPGQAWRLGARNCSVAYKFNDLVTTHIDSLDPTTHTLHNIIDDDDVTVLTSNHTHTSRIAMIWWIAHRSRSQGQHALYLVPSQRSISMQSRLILPTLSQIQVLLPFSLWRVSTSSTRGSPLTLWRLTIWRQESQVNTHLRYCNPGVARGVDGTCCPVFGDCVINWHQAAVKCWMHCHFW